MTDRFVGTWPDPVMAGGSLYPVYSNPARAGQTITIKIVDTGNGRVVDVPMTLDANGNGSVAWAVPLDWGVFATLEGPDSIDHLIAVEPVPPV
jgi:hypothetical protein